MRARNTWRLPFIAALAACSLLAPAAHAQPVATEQVAIEHAEPAWPAGKLLAALRGGGYVVYFRHAATDFSQNDDRMTGYEDCRLQRNLTDAGREDARTIGAAWRALAIPADEVLASPFCRTMETARLIFGRATSSAAVRGGPASTEGGRYRQLVALLTKPVPAGTNRVIVSHGNPYRAVIGTSYLGEGEAAIIEPLGERGMRIVGRVPKDGWRRLAGP
jgi:phosphohistidine phosphatase SixA